MVFAHVRATCLVTCYDLYRDDIISDFKNTAAFVIFYCSKARGHPEWIVSKQSTINV